MSCKTIKDRDERGCRSVEEHETLEAELRDGKLSL